MDRQVIEQKLESLRRCLARLDSKRPAQAADLLNNIDLQDIVSLNLSRAVQISVDIAAHLVSSMDVAPPATMGQTFELLAQQHVLPTDLASRMKKAVGFRNIAVHSYEAINWQIVYSIIKFHLDDFSAFAKIIAQHTSNHRKNSLDT